MSEALYDSELGYKWAFFPSLLASNVRAAMNAKRVSFDDKITSVFGAHIIQMSFYALDKITFGGQKKGDEIDGTMQYGSTNQVEQANINEYTRFLWVYSTKRRISPANGSEEIHEGSKPYRNTGINREVFKARAPIIETAFSEDMGDLLQSAGGQAETRRRCRVCYVVLDPCDQLFCVIDRSIGYRNWDLTDIICM